MMAKEPPEISEAESREIRNEVRGMVNAMLVARGVPDATRNRAVADLSDRIRIVPRFGGPEVRIQGKMGMVPVNPRTLGAIAEELVGQATAALSGPDPVKIAADQVVFLTGADRERVLELVDRKARREADGTIVVTLPSSRPFDPVNPQPRFAELRGEVGMDALVRWAAGQIGHGASAEQIEAKRESGNYGGL